MFVQITVLNISPNIDLLLDRPGSRYHNDTTLSIKYQFIQLNDLHYVCLYRSLSVNCAPVAEFQVRIRLTFIDVYFPLNKTM